MLYKNLLTQWVFLGRVTEFHKSWTTGSWGAWSFLPSLMTYKSLIQWFQYLQLTTYCLSFFIFYYYYDYNNFHKTSKTYLPFPSALYHPNFPISRANYELHTHDLHHHLLFMIIIIIVLLWSRWPLQVTLDIPDCFSNF